MMGKQDDKRTHLQFLLLRMHLTEEFKLSTRLLNKLGPFFDVSWKRAALFCLRSWLSGSTGAIMFSLGKRHVE